MAFTGNITVQVDTSWGRDACRFDALARADRPLTRAELDELAALAEVARLAAWPSLTISGFAEKLRAW